MNRIIAVIILILVGLSLLAAVLSPSSAQQAGQSAQSTKRSTPATEQRVRPRTLEDFDIRAGIERSLATPPADATPPTGESQSGSKKSAQAATSTKSVGPRESRLMRERPQARIRYSSLSGTPSRIDSLTQTLSEAREARPANSARRFLKRHRDLFRLTDEEVNQLKVIRNLSSKHNGLTHLTLQQTIDEVEVFQGEYSIHLDREGAVIAASGEVFPEAARAANPRRPKLSSLEALRRAADYLDVQFEDNLRVTSPPQGAMRRQTIGQTKGGGAFAREVDARLAYFPLTADQLRLAWEFTVWMNGTPDVYLILVDAERGSLLYRYNLTWYCWENPSDQAPRVPRAPRGSSFFPNLVRPDLVENRPSSIEGPHGLVFTGDSPRPDLPFNNPTPPVVDREDAPFYATSYLGATIFDGEDFHFDWWAGKPPVNLTTNNAIIYLDRDANDLPDEPRLKSPESDFTYELDLSQSPLDDQNQKSAQVNLFYWVNRYHDILYLFGFDEESGNFQKNNFGLGGRGNDPIIAEAQDGSGTNNANYSGGRDGYPGRIQMFLWSGSPQLDSDLDQAIILHELTHGLSTRLVGNGTGLTGVQGRGLGEGWSDYFGLTLLRRPNDDPHGSYPIGQYAFNNYQFGIRRFPYSVNPHVYPFNFGDLARNTEAHAVGEIWCNALLEMRALLIRQWGFEEGQRQSIQLVVDGLKLTPSSPTFLDARRALMLADRINNGGANQCLIWQAFGKRGMGFSAGTLDANDGAPVDSFDAPPFCATLGTVAFDQTNYLPGETIELSVGDLNAAAPVKIRVRSSVTGDEEQLTLKPDSLFNGSYVTGLPLVEGKAQLGDGILQASRIKQDELIAMYDDANDGSGSPRQVSVRTRVAGERTLLNDSVEFGNRGWSVTGSPGSTWALTNTRSASPSSAWTDSPSGNYLNNSDVALVSPLLDLSRAASVTLAFGQSYSLERGFDYGIVEYSADDGATWRRATAFTGTQSAFAQAKLSLNGLAGCDRARIRFRLKSDATTTMDGWYLDDIRVIGRSSDPAFLPAPSELAPLITAVSPAYGSPDGGARVTLSGANFTETGDAKVYFDGIAATEVTVLGGNSLSAVAPAHAPGAVGVQIETRTGAGSIANAFTYFDPDEQPRTPEILGIFPTSGPTTGSMGAGTVVTVSGANFTPATKVRFASRNGGVIFVNSQILRVAVPPSPNQAVGPVDLTIVNAPDRHAKLIKAFTYYAPTPPTVQLLSHDGGERIFIGSTTVIRWRSADDRAVRAHRVDLYKRNGSNMVFVANIASDIAGEAQSVNWAVPTSVPPMNRARIRVVAIDDEGAEAEVFSSGDLKIENRWETLTNLAIQVQREAVASDGRHLYAFGGRVTGNSVNTVAVVQRYDPMADPPSWSAESVPPMPRELNAAKAVFINGKIYIPGGINSNIEIKGDQFVYDAANNSWASAAAPPVPVFLYSLAAESDRKIYYLTGGADAQAAISNVQAYDSESDSWSSLPPMKTARYAHESALINGKLYVVGGFGASGGLAGGEVYDFAAQKWTQIAKLSRPRQYAASAIGRDQAGRLFWLIIGGEDANNGEPLSSIEAYDVERNRWRVLDASFNLPAPRTRFGSAVLDGQLHIVGGVIQAGASTTSAAHERFKLEGFTLVEPNQPPVLAVPTAPQIAIPNHELTFSVTAQDLGSDAPLSISAEGLPANASFVVSNQTNNSAIGLLTWTPSITNVGRTYQITLTAGDGQLIDVKSASIKVVAASPLTAVNSADFRLSPIAVDSIASAFGTNLADRIETARSMPLPFSLADTTVTINGTPAPLFFVSPTQINFVVPASIAPGTATIIVSNTVGPVGGVGTAGFYSVGQVEIRASAPAIFTADASGRGEAAALATIDGVNYLRPPFDLTLAGKPNILVLFGLGFRGAPATNPNDDDGVAESVTVTIDGRPARVLYAGAQGGYSGLDQLNIELPVSLADRLADGESNLEIAVSVNGVATNRVYVRLK